MNHDIFATSLTTLYHVLYERLHTRWDKNEYRPSAETLALLRHLEFSGPITVGEAAQHFDRAQSAMSELFERVEAHGLIARVKDGRDKRRTLVWLTDDGVALLRRCDSVLDVRLLVQCARQMSDASKEQLIAGMRDLITASETISRNDTGGTENDG